LTLTGGEFVIPQEALIVIDGPDPQALAFSAQQLSEALRACTGADWAVVAGTAVPADQIGALLSLVPGGVGHPQGYKLTISSERISIIAQEPAGLFYGVQTLRQILGHSSSSQTGVTAPTLRIDDWPDFPNRGVMLDISRDKVPTMEAIYDLVDQLARVKINQFQLYMEHTFAYRSHPLVWADASPVTGEEILALDAYCRERFIELVPNQNMFGHLHRWLEHPEYIHLAEAPDGAQTPWGYFCEGPFSISPAVPESLDLIRSMLNELLPHFSSRQVNIGGDETYDLGQGRSKALVEERGSSQVYLDFLLKIYREVDARGRTMQVWGDIIMENPELALQLPRDVVALEWGYEADHPFAEHCAIFSASGIPYYVCPGVSDWNTVGGRTENAIGNLQNAAQNGLRNGAAGYLITEWGDNGHWQPLPTAYLGFYYGAALAWNQAGSWDLDIPDALNRHAFQDVNGVMGRVAYDLGNVYTLMTDRPHNSTPLFHILQKSPDELLALVHERQDEHSLRGELVHVLTALEALRPLIAQSNMQRPDAGLIRREYEWATDMLIHACHRMTWLLDREQGEDDAAARRILANELVHLMSEHEAIWMARNRAGGFVDSQARLAKLRADYA
jgi:hypothetical protein